MAKSRKSGSPEAKDLSLRAKLDLDPSDVNFLRALRESFSAELRELISGHAAEVFALVDDFSRRISGVVRDDLLNYRASGTNLKLQGELGINNTQLNFLADQRREVAFTLDRARVKPYDHMVKLLALDSGTVDRLISEDEEHRKAQYVALYGSEICANGPHREALVSELIDRWVDFNTHENDRLELLAAMHSIYLEDDEKLRFYVGKIDQLSNEQASRIDGYKSVWEGREVVFNVFFDFVKKEKCKDDWYDAPSKWIFENLVKYQDDPEMFKFLAGIYVKKGWEFVSKIMNQRDVHDCQPEKASALGRYLEGKYEKQGPRKKDFFTLFGDRICGGNIRRRELVYERMGQWGTQRLRFMAAMAPFYVDDGKFDNTCDVVEPLPDEQAERMMEYYSTWNQRESICDIFLNFVRSEKCDGTDRLNSPSRYFFNKCSRYRHNVPVFKLLANQLKGHGVERLESVLKAEKVFGRDLRKLLIVVSYFDCGAVYDEKILNNYVGLYENSGKEMAEEYIKSLFAKAKGLMGPGVPGECRKLPEYQYLVRYSYPAGNYSNHEKNLACGDKLEHLEGYEYRKEGYPAVMSGLLGYGMKQGAEEDLEVLESYSGRLDRMREFVASRGPDNEALQQAFDKEVDTMFEKLALAEFKSIEGMSVKEKMLCIFVSEVLRRHKSVAEREKPPRSEVLDLIVEYKYAYNEDLENYIHRSADGVKIYTDPVSQHYMLLSELSVIYGENLKHVLRHDIFESLIESENYPKILDAYIANLGEEKELDLTSKQWQRVDNTINNPHIKEDGEVVEGRYKPGRWEVFSRQIFDVFSSNIKFDSDEDRAEFTEKINEAISRLKGQLSVEGLKGLLPKLFSIRNAYAFKINAKLSEFFQHDINNVFRELAKYEEIVEEESKEKKIGGPKDNEVKKSHKKRNIRGYINKTAETANARMGAYLCLAGDEKMWQNPNYFELVLEDEDTHKCVGVVMLLNIEAKDGKKYLWFGPNPFESFLEQVSSKQCYEYMYKMVCEFAEENDFDGVVVPPKDEQILGQCTNRGGDFPGLIQASRLRDKKENLKIVKFGKKHVLSDGYGYEEGALVWEKSKRVA